MNEHEIYKLKALGFHTSNDDYHLSQYIALHPRCSHMLQPLLPLPTCHKGRQKSWKRARGRKERGELEYGRTYKSHQAFRVCSNGQLSHGGTNNTVRKTFPWDNGGAYPWGKVDPRGKSPVLLCAYIFSCRVVHILFQDSGFSFVNGSLFGS